MSTTKRLGVRLVAENGQQVRAEFEGVGRSGEQAFQKIERQADLTGAAITKLAGMLATAFSVRQIVQYADTWSDLSSRVRLAAGSHEAGIAVMQRLEEVARRTYSSLDQTVEGWTQNAGALQELGFTLGETLDYTEALNNALVVSGARAERAASVQNALTQAMALGELRGQRLNTVIINGGRVAELLAAELGVGVNQLRALGAQGLITGEVIQRALVGNIEKLREEAESMPATIGDAFALMGNAALQLVGRWDQLLGASESVATALIGVADNLERLAAYAIAFGGFMAGRWVAAFVAARAATMTLSGALVLLRGAIIRTGIGALIVGAGEMIYWFGQLVKGAGGFSDALTLLGDVASGVWEGIIATAKAVPDALEGVWQRLSEGFLKAVADMAYGWADFIAAVAGAAEGLGSVEVMGMRPFAGMATSIRGAATTALGGANDVMASSLAAGSASRAAFDRAGSAATAGFENARTAAARLADAVTGAGADGEDALDRTNSAAQRLTEEMENAGRGGGRAADRIAEGMEKAAETVQSLAEAMRSSFENAFVAIVSGTAKARDALRSLLQDLSRMLAQRAFRALAGALFPAPAGAPLNAMASGPLVGFSGGGFTGWGPRSGGLDGQGGFLAMLHPRETVIDHHRGGGQAVTVNVVARSDPGVILNIAQSEAVRVTRAGIAEYDRAALPSRMAQLQRDPRRRFG